VAGDKLSRRTVLKGSVAGLAGCLSAGLKPTAGPFSAQDYRSLVPEDKKLTPEWLASLFDRGEEPWVGREGVRTIGMPVGGLFAGTVYLGGDGRLWNWDIFNQHHLGAVMRTHPVEFRGRSLNEIEGANYVSPPAPQSPFKLEFLLESEGDRRLMDSRGWESVRFLGKYPVGTVEYNDGDLFARLDAFSPFIPLNVEDSSFPAVVMRFSVRNNGDRPRHVRLMCNFENPVLLYSRTKAPDAVLVSKVFRARQLEGVVCSARAIDMGNDAGDILFDDFESGEYRRWIPEGSAFGTKPTLVREMPSYQGDVNAEGRYVVNTHNARHGEDVRQADEHIGTLTSEPFVIERDFINFRIGGGNHVGKTELQLLIGDKVVRSATGSNSNRMRFDFFDVRDLRGQTARLRGVDNESGGWGHIAFDDIVFSDKPRREGSLEDLADFGTFAVCALGGKAVATDRGCRTWIDMEVQPGDERVAHFIIAWHFPNCSIPGLEGQKRWYAGRWVDAKHVGEDLAKRLDELERLTMLWVKTWYDNSTLPWWLLVRTFASVSTLATNTCYRFADGRFWFWEGVGCCHGTCTHVWGYAQGIARVFPEVERYLREEIDFGMSFHEETGAIDYRGEFGRQVAHDGQCNCVLRAYREHTMQRDDGFLRRRWPRIKRALQFLINEDRDRDGLLEGGQYNTLDADWYGPMAWISSLYLAALRAGEAMAKEMGDEEFASECASLIEVGSKRIVEQLFNGEYFIHKPDPAHPEANATGDGCHADQLFGESYLRQLGLARVVPERETLSALRSLYRYNFTPDVGPYRDGMRVIQGGRWYAMPGEGGLIVCTFPKGGAERATGQGPSAWAAQYFNEVWTGFEYQVASHMIAEGLVTEGLAIVKMAHERYSPERRNPYNEIECSDHYGRALAAFGVYLSLTGFRHHGPRGRLEIQPVLPGDHRFAFIAADGWGTVQTRDGQPHIQYSYRLGGER
jgi:non-lysosomal glucosylceramidase